MNSFGRIFRVQIFGESHGPCVGVVVDGCPAGLALEAQEFESDLSRRRAGAGGTTARREPDAIRILSGVFEGRTTGAPILLQIDNVDADPGPYEQLRFTPRPGHADLVAAKKFGGFHDPRGGGHFSGRLTVALVAASVVARKILGPVAFESRVLEAGGRADVETVVAEAVASGDSVGGVVECRVRGIRPGLGEPFFDSVESLVSHLVFSIGGVRGIEFGAGFASSRMAGSECNDPILEIDGKTATNHAGGVNGGITNGNELCFRVAIKPTSSIPVPQRTVDLRTGEPATITVEGRHDACIALRTPVILEAAAAVVLADLALLQRATAPKPIRGDAP